MTLKIDARQRKTLRDLMGHRFFLGGERRLQRAREEGVSHEQLAGEFGADMRLMEDVGWGEEELQPRATPEGTEVELRMPISDLAGVLRRARDDACTEIEEGPRCLPTETESERRQRLRLAARTCEELLNRLKHREENEP